MRPSEVTTYEVLRTAAARQALEVQIPAHASCRDMSMRNRPADACFSSQRQGPAAKANPADALQAST